MAEGGSAEWQLKLLDHFQLGDARGDAGLTASKAVAVLGYLALQRNRTARRDTIAGLLWENVETAQGRVNLRQALTAVRRAEAGGAAILRADADTLTLSDAVETDVDRFDRLARGDADQRRIAADLYQTDVMAGFSVRDAPAFNEWLVIAQAQWRQRAVGLLMGLAEEALAPGGDLNAGAAAALKLLAIDPLNEAGHRALMRIYARQGRAALAIAQYRSLGELLRSELQVAPDAETQALFEELSRGRRQPPPAPAPKPAPPAHAPASNGPPTAGTDDRSWAAAPAEAGRLASETAPSDQRPRDGLITKPTIAAAAALLLACLAAALLWTWTGRHEPPRIKRIFSIAATDDQETSPALSPDGRSVIYSARKDDNVDLFLVPVEGRGEPVRLTSDTLEDRGAAWSPDGRTIAFARGDRSGATPCSIMVRAMPAGPERMVGRCRTQGSTQMAWERSGKALFFYDDADRNRASQIFRLPLDGGAAVAVSHPPDYVYGDARPLPSWNGKRLAFVREMGLDSSAVAVEELATGTADLQVPNTPGLADAAWSRNDLGLIYSMPDGSDAGLWWQASDRSVPRIRLSTGLASYSVMSFSPQANRLAVQVSQDRRNMFRLSMQANSLTQQPIAGLRPEISDRYVAPGPGGRVALVSSRAGSNDLWVTRPFLPLRQLTRGFSFGQPAWSPDGRFIAASSEAGAQSDIYLIDAASGRIFRVTHDAASDSFPSWTADGRFLVWSSLRGGVASVWIFEPRRPRQPPRQLAGSGIGLLVAGGPGDNAYYYVRYGSPGLLRRPFDTNGDFAGEETVVLPGMEITRTPSWAVTSDGIMHLRRDDPTGPRFLYRYARSTGKDTRIEGSDVLKGRLALSSAADGTVLITETTSQNDITGIDFE